MRRLYVLALIALTAVGVLGSVGTAHAAPSDPFVYKYSFGEELNLKFEQMAVNYATGNVLVAASDGNIHQFDSNGNPVEFSAAGSFTIPAGSNFSVDNSGGPTQGNIYVTVAPSLVDGVPGYRAFHADGSPIGMGYAGPGAYVPLYEGLGGGALCAVTPAPDGNIWLAVENLSLTEVTPNGVPTGRQANLVGNPNYSYRCTMMFDGAGNFYSRSGAAKYDASDDFAYLGETGLPDRLELPLAVDPSTLDLYQANEAGGLPGNPAKGSVVSVPYTDPLVKQNPFEALSSAYGIKRAGGAAFAASGQTLYLAEGFYPADDSSKIRVFHREPPSVPYDLVESTAVRVRSQESGLRAGLSAGGAPVTYRFEYGTSTSYGQSTEPTTAPFSYYPTEVGATAMGLQPSTTYHVRLVATNSAGTTYGSDSTFTTYPVPPGSGADPCPNALARKQTIAARLPDCRAYELVSAADTGGYDVESYLAPGQAPFPGFPMATDRLLYAIHSGAVPGRWNATNKGPDPYLATRAANGWVTSYKGLPANLNPEAGSFSSVLGEADSQLDTLAFAGPNLCDPCFTDGGLRTGLPVRLPSGQLVQGMSGSLAGSVPDAAKPEGKIAKYFSADGKHLLFASKYAFEPGANTGGELTVYDRNLATGKTQIASTDQAANPLTGTVSELDVSADGSRIVTASRISEDAQGNEYVHPWMHIGSSPSSVDLAPGTTTGVLYAGMTSDGAKVLFTSKDRLLGADGDEGADLYEAAVDAVGNLNLSLISETNSDACSPVANANGEHWNTGGPAVDCGVVAIAGGGGVASASGAAYFLSPESFGGEGAANQPNLYLAQPGGAPSFVATLEPDNPLVLDSVKANAVRRSGDFQTTASGGYAAFTSNLDLSALSTHGFRSVYRFEAGTGQLDCASCDRTGANEAGVSVAAELPPNGLALLGDGRLFFTTAAQLVLNDANGRKDVYQWSVGDPLLISAGAGPFDSGLLTASADGTDVFFFTQDTLASGEDFNGSLVKVYDARVGGGFFKLPASVPCQASDECHGPGAEPGSAPDIRSSGKTTAGNVLVCPKNRVKKRGKCVKKPIQRKNKKAKKKAKKRNTQTTGKRGGRHA